MNENNYCYKYPRPSVTTDAVIFGFNQSEGLSLLLIKRKNNPYKDYWAFPGGFLEMDEDAETGARRELKEETGLDIAHLEQFGTFTQVDRDPRGRVISIAYYAVVKQAEVNGGDDAVEAKWFPITSLPPLAFDHAMIFSKSIKSIREKIHHIPIGLNLLPETFTIDELTYLYECLLGESVDVKALTSALLEYGVISVIEGEINDMYSNSKPRYRFNDEKYLFLKQKGEI